MSLPTFSSERKDKEFWTSPMEAFQTALNNALIVERSVPVAVLPEQETPGGSFFLSSVDERSTFLVSLVYSFNRSDANTVDVIKRALSQVLVHYYPLAGRLARNSQGKLTVDCSNKLGVAFVEASANCDIEDLGDTRLLDSNVLQKLVYRDPTENMLEVAPLLTTQVTNFRCGGFSLGISVNHCMFDGSSTANFMNSWAEIARGEPISLVPYHERTAMKSRVPPRASCAYDGFTTVRDVSNLTALFEEEQIVLKGFHFNSEKLAILKKRAIADGQVISSCSSFVALAALVWRARSMALKMKSHQLSKLILMVDVRSKLKPPMPGYVGNAAVGTFCHCTAGELINEPICSTAGRIKKAIERVNEEFVWSCIDYVGMFESDLLSLSTLAVTSWQRFDYGRRDFGWGEPRNIGISDLPRTSCLVMRDGSESKGVVVQLGLPLSAMNTFEQLLPSLTCEPETPSVTSRARL